MADLEHNQDQPQHEQQPTVKISDSIAESVFEVFRESNEFKKLNPWESIIDAFNRFVSADSLLDINVKSTLWELARLRWKSITELTISDVESLTIDSKRALRHLERYKQKIGTATVKSAVVSAAFEWMDRSIQDLFTLWSFQKDCRENGWWNAPVPTDVHALRDYFLLHSSNASNPYVFVEYITWWLGHTLNKNYKNDPERLELERAKIATVWIIPWNRIDDKLQALGLRCNGFQKEQLKKWVLYTENGSTVRLTEGLSEINNDISILLMLGIEDAKVDALWMFERLKTAHNEVITAPNITKPHHLKLTKSEFRLMNKHKWWNQKDITTAEIDRRYQEHLNQYYADSLRWWMSVTHYQEHSEFTKQQNIAKKDAIPENQKLKEYKRKLIKRSVQTLRDFADEYAMPKDSLVILEKFFDPTQMHITLPWKGSIVFKKKDVLLIDPTNSHTDSQLRRPLLEVDLEKSTIPPYLRNFLNLPDDNNLLWLQKNEQQWYLCKSIAWEKHWYGKKLETIGWYSTKQWVTPLRYAQWHHESNWKLESCIEILEEKLHAPEVWWTYTDSVWTLSLQQIIDDSVQFESSESLVTQTIWSELFTKNQYMWWRKVSFFEAIEWYSLNEKWTTYQQELDFVTQRLESMVWFKKLSNHEKEQKRSDIKQSLKKKRWVSAVYNTTQVFWSKETTDQKYQRLWKTKFVNLKDSPDDIPVWLQEFHSNSSPIAWRIESSGQIVANSQYRDIVLGTYFGTKKLPVSVDLSLWRVSLNPLAMVEDDRTALMDAMTQVWVDISQWVLSIQEFWKIIALFEKKKWRSFFSQTLEDYLQECIWGYQYILEKFKSRKNHESMHRILMMQKNIGILGESYSGLFEGYRTWYHTTLRHEEVLPLEIKLTKWENTFNPTHELLCKIVEWREYRSYAQINNKEKENALNVCDGWVVIESNLDASKNWTIKLQRIYKNTQSQSDDKYKWWETIEFSAVWLNESLHEYLWWGLLVLKDGVQSIQSFGGSKSISTQRTWDLLDKNNFDSRYVRQYSLRQSMSSDQVDLADAANTQSIDENSTDDEIGQAYATYDGGDRIQDQANGSDPNALNYVSTIRRYIASWEKERFEHVARAIRTQMETEAETLWLELTEFWPQDTWAYWHLAKTKYISDNRDALSQNPKYKKYERYVWDPLDPQNQHIRDFIKNVHLWFEATAQQGISQFPDEIQERILELQEKWYDDTSSMEFAELWSALSQLPEIESLQTNNQNSTQSSTASTATSSPATSRNRTLDQSEDEETIPLSSVQEKEKQRKEFEDEFDKAFMGDETVKIDDNPVILARAQWSKLQWWGSLRYTWRIETNENSDDFRVVFDSTTEVDKTVESKTFPKTVDSIKQLRNSLKELYAFKSWVAYADMKAQADTFSEKKWGGKVSKAQSQFDSLVKDGNGYKKKYMADDAKTTSMEPVTHRWDLNKRNGWDNVLFEVTPEGDKVRVTAKNTWNSNHLAMDHVMDSNAFLIFIADKGLKPYVEKELDREWAKNPNPWSDENQAWIQKWKRSDNFVSISAMLAWLKKLPEKFKYRFEQEEKYQASLFIKQYASFIPDGMTFLYANEIKNDLMTEHDDTIWSVINSYKDQISQKDGAWGTHAKVIAQIIEKEVFLNPSNAIRSRHKAAWYLLYAAEKWNMYIRNLKKYADQWKWTEIMLWKDKAKQMREERDQLYARMRTAGATEDEYDKLVKYEMYFIFKHTTDHPYFWPKFGRALEWLHDKYSGSADTDGVKNEQLSKWRFDVIYSETFTGWWIWWFNPKVIMGALEAMEKKVEDRNQYSIFYSSVIQVLLSWMASFEFDQNMKSKFKWMCRRIWVPIGLFVGKIDHPTKIAQLLNYIMRSSWFEWKEIEPSIMEKIKNLWPNNFSTQYKDISSYIWEWFSNSQVSETIIDAFNYKNTFLLKGLADEEQVVQQYFGSGIVFNPYKDYKNEAPEEGDSPFYDGIFNLWRGTFQSQLLDEVLRSWKFGRDSKTSNELRKQFSWWVQTFTNIIDDANQNSSEAVAYGTFIRKKFKLYFWERIGDENFTFLLDAIQSGDEWYFKRILETRLLWVSYNSRWTKSMSWVSWEKLKDPTLKEADRVVGEYIVNSSMDQYIWMLRKMFGKIPWGKQKVVFETNP